MPKAVLNGIVIAESDTTEVVEGNHYFSLDSVNQEFLKSSDTQTFCPWKGTASYYHVEVNGTRVDDGAWYYPDPENAASQIKDMVAFWKDVEIQE